MVSVMIICFFGGVLAAAWTQVEETNPRGTYASLFDPSVVDLHLAGESSVDAFLGSSNLAPGDELRGTLRLSTSGATDDILDLDFDVRIEGTGLPSEGPRLDRILYVTHLSYGRDNLLSDDDGGFNLLRTIDSDPIAGNADGRLSLAELTAGSNDLPPPKDDTEGGTPFTIALVFQPNGPTHSSTFRGQHLDVTFVFRLSDALDADLN